MSKTETHAELKARLRFPVLNFTRSEYSVYQRQPDRGSAKQEGENACAVSMANDENMSSLGRAILGPAETWGLP